MTDTEILDEIQEWLNKNEYILENVSLSLHYDILYQDWYKMGLKKATSEIRKIIFKE